MDKPTPPLEPTRAALRASDMDRERVAALLRDHFSDGRLTLEEFQEDSFWPIWPILVGGLILAFDVLGLERPGRRGRHRRMDRHERRKNSDRHSKDG